MNSEIVLHKEETIKLQTEALGNSIELLCSKINIECSRVKYSGDFQNINKYKNKVFKFNKLYKDSKGEKDYDSLISSTFNKIQEVKSLLNSLKNEELWGADPNCNHNVVFGDNGGICCTKCRGWQSY